MLILVVLMGVLWSGAAQADPYYNSDEPGCAGATPTVLLCENMEKRGDGTTGTAPITGAWFEVPDNNRTNTFNKGWSPNPDPITNRAVSCGAGVTPFGNCAGYTDGQPQHYLKTPTCGTNGGQLCNVAEAYFRWYMKIDSTMTFGEHKHMTITNSDGDIAFVNVKFNCGGSPGQTTTPPVAIQVNYGNLLRGGSTGLNTSCTDAGSGPDGRTGGGTTDVNMTRGRWWFMELHIRVGSSARVRYWANDCGPTATFNCGAAPILRVDTTGTLPGNANGSQIQTIWPETWCAGCGGGGVMYDNIKVSTVGPIGFSGSSGTGPDTTPPTAPLGVTIASER